MIVTVARDEGLRLRVAAALRDSEWSAPVMSLSSVGEVEELLASSAPPNAFVVGADIGLSGAIDVVVATAGMRTSAPVFLVADLTTDVLRRAMRAGVRDVLPPDFEAGDLVGAFAEARVRTSGPPPKPGLTVAVFSTKGGVGTSVVASNLAARLGEQTDGPVTLVDLDLASADQSIMHGLSPRWTVQDAADGTIGLDAESLGQALVTISGTNVRLLPGPLDPALAETITAANVGSIIAACRAEAPIAVLDTSSGFDDRTLAALDAADVIVVVSSLDVAALRALTVSLQTLERLGVDHDHIDVVVVRSDSKSGLGLGDVARAIGRRVNVGVPSMRAVPRSVNEGVPMAVSSRRSGVVKAIDELAERVLRHAATDLETEQDDDGDGLLGGIFSWSRSTSADADGPSEAEDPSREKDSRDASRRPSPASVDDGAPTAQEHEGDAARGPVPEQETEPSPKQAGRVVHLREHSGSSRSAVSSKRPSPPKVDPPAMPPKGEGDDDDDGPAADGRSRLDALPPPVVVDDDDDQPRRRRRR